MQNGSNFFVFVEESLLPLPATLAEQAFTMTACGHTGTGNSAVETGSRPLGNTQTLIPTVTARAVPVQLKFIRRMFHHRGIQHQ